MKGKKISCSIGWYRDKPCHSFLTGSLPLQLFTLSNFQPCYFSISSIVLSFLLLTGKINTWPLTTPELSSVSKFLSFQTLEF